MSSRLSMGSRNQPAVFRADQATVERVNVVFRVELFRELPAAGIEPPGAEFPRLHAEWHSRDQRRGGDLALVVSEPRVTGGHLAFAHRVDDVEGRHDLAGLEELHEDAAAGSGFNSVLDVQYVVAEYRQIRGKCDRDAPAELGRYGACFGWCRSGTSVAGRPDSKTGQQADQKRDADGDSRRTIG